MKTKNIVGAFALLLLLAACGGGGSSTTTTPTTPPPTVSALQGLWQSPTANASGTTAAVVLPDGQVWALVNDAAGANPGTHLVKATLAAQGNSFSGSATSYALGANGNTGTAVNMSATVVEHSRLSGSIASDAYDLTYLARYDTPVALADFAGNWTANLGPGTVSWSIANDGTLSGTRTTGCIYMGKISLRAELKAVADVAMTEVCDSTVTQLRGVAALRADKSRISFFMTSTDEATALVVSLAH